MHSNTEMDRLKELTSLLSSIKTLSTKIIKKAVPVMKDLENDSSELVQDVIDDLGEKHPDEEDILERLRTSSLDRVADAEAVMREIESFAEAINQGEEALDRCQDQYPFLFEVWYGDIYESGGIEGLKILRKNLTQQLSNTSEEKIIEDVINSLRSVHTEDSKDE